jgi:CBS domain-containing protein
MGMRRLEAQPIRAWLSAGDGLRCRLLSQVRFEGNAHYKGMHGVSTVRQILDAKGREVCTISDDEMVLGAIRQMADRDIGALVVVDGDDNPIGIFTERHYARNVFLKGRSSPTTPVRDAIRTGFYWVAPERTVEECMALMTEYKVRHLPVMKNGEVIGIVSMGDLAKSIIADREFTIEQLTNYISGSW